MSIDCGKKGKKRENEGGLIDFHVPRKKRGGGRKGDPLSPSLIRREGEASFLYRGLKKKGGEGGIKKESPS